MILSGVAFQRGQLLHKVKAGNQIPVELETLIRESRYN